MMRSKIGRMYGEMRSIENAMEDQIHELDAPTMMARINELEQRAIICGFLPPMTSSLYTMRLHIGLLRSHLDFIVANDTLHGSDNDQSSARRPSAEFCHAPPDRQSAD